MPSRSGPHAGKCRLSECNTPGVLECRPGPKRIPPVYSVVQQKSFQESARCRLPILGVHPTPDSARWFRSFPSRPDRSRQLWSSPVEAVAAKPLHLPPPRPAWMSSPAILSRPAELCGCCGVRTTLRRLRDENPEGRPSLGPAKRLDRLCFSVMTPMRQSPHSRPSADAGFEDGSMGSRRPGPLCQIAGSIVPRHSPKPMRCEALAPAVRPHDDGVAVFQEAAGLAGRERDRPPPAGGDFEQAAEPVFPGRGDGAGRRTGRPDAGCSRRWCDGRRAGRPSSRDGARCRRKGGAAGSPCDCRPWVSRKTSSSMSRAPAA